MLPKSYKEENRFETVMELYEAGSPNLKLYRVFLRLCIFTKSRRDIT
jgi:hypothetical protein